MSCDHTSPQPCPTHTYTVLPASTSCYLCPVGYNCSNPASIPVAMGNTPINCTSLVCPAGFMCSRDGSWQLCPQGEYLFEGQRTCQMCPEGFSCSDPSAVPVLSAVPVPSLPTSCFTDRYVTILTFTCSHSCPYTVAINLCSF